MYKRNRLSLLTGVALPLFLATSATGFTGELSVRTSGIVLAQADGLAAAQAEVAAAQAALEDAQANGGDVAAAQAQLNAALNALAGAQAAGQPQPEPGVPLPPEQPPAQAPQPAEPNAPASVQPPEPIQPAEPSQPDAVDGQEPAQEPAPGPSGAPEVPAQSQTPADLAPPSPNPIPPEQPQDTNSAPAPEARPLNNEPSATSPRTDAPSPTKRPNSAGSNEAAQPPVLAPPTDTDREQPSTPSARQPERTDTPVRAQQPPQESAVESQLEAQGDSEAIENVRTLREKLRRGFARGEPTADDVAPGTDARSEVDRRDDGRRGDSRRGDDSDRRGGDRRRPAQPDGGDIVLDFGGGFVVELGDQLVIRRDGAEDSDRFLDRARDVEVERFKGGFTRTTVTRRDGTRLYTVRTRDGDILTRTRATPDGRQIVLIDNRQFYRDGRRPRYTRFDEELPPLRLGIPRDQYVVETSRYGRDDIRRALLAPPVEAVERSYALEEIRTSQRLRDKLRRVDLNTITFDFGSASISPSQFDALAVVGSAVEDILARSPNEIFMVEGYTDAVGSPTDNLILSDRRAEAIAVALSSNFAIPPENLVTQGFGEQYLKVATEAAERENRRVTMRRITPLVAQGS